MSDAQGKLEFTPHISKSSIRQYLSLPRADPCHLFYLHCLETDSHFLSSGQTSDPDKSILVFTKAIYLPFTQDTSPSFQNIVQIVYQLAMRVFFRAEKSGRPEDIRSCIKFFRYLHGQWHQVSMKFPVPVTTVLVHALAMQVELGFGDVDQDMEEMAGLCDELLNSEISIGFVTDPIADFARTVDVHSLFRDGRECRICSEKVIDCLRKAMLRLPGLHLVSTVLARSLYDRFVVAPSDDDYEEAMVILEALLAFRDSGDEPSSHKVEALDLASLLAISRFDAYGKPEDLEHAIYCYRAVLDAASIDDPRRAVIIKHLSYFEGLRLDGTAYAKQAISMPPESGKIPPFRELIASLPGPIAVKPNPTESVRKHLDALRASFTYQLDIADVKDAIKYCRRLLVSYPRSDLAGAAHIALGELLLRAFHLTHKTKYLDKAISSTRDGINTVNLLSSRGALVNGLISYLSTRLELLHHEEDLHELM
jgi:tetratricopeptide (TPR) repeat protein